MIGWTGLTGVIAGIGGIAGTGVIAGATWQWWLGFHAAVALLLVADGLWSSRPQPAPGLAQSPRSALSTWLAPALLLLCAAAFDAWLWAAHGRQSGLEWAAGYTVELSLSVDNLFVFMAIFQGFHAGPGRQHKALLWGVAGAVVLRALFILAGVALLRRFAFVTWVFGLFLLYAAWRMFRGRAGAGVLPAGLPVWLRRLQPRPGSRLPAILPLILAVELTDLIFAIDSIPAVLAVTRHPLLAYTSNIAAILGLRSLYFALAAALGRFPSLRAGVAALLAFVALKMLASPWLNLPIGLSLAVMALILAACIGYDLATRKPAEASGV